MSITKQVPVAPSNASRPQVWLSQWKKTIRCTVPADYLIIRTRSQAVARIADRTASQHLWGSRDVIGHVTNW